jgi:maltose alpha-D-glucosyltransferase/alpha-amylase
LEQAALQRCGKLLDRTLKAVRTRCHGDFHLGQVLFTGNDFVIIDFEGEPQRPISERRIKTSPLRDVAGMIRSFHYASYAVQQDSAQGTIAPRDSDGGRQSWLEVWYMWSTAAFLRAYNAEAARSDFLPSEREELSILLDAYLLEKAVYELVYELNNRPDWIQIPLEGIRHLLQTTPI